MQWSIHSSQQVVQMLKTKPLPKNSKLTIADFSTLYTSLQHTDILQSVNRIIDMMFANGGHKYMSVGRSAYYHSDEKRNARKFCKQDIQELLHFVVTNSYVTYGSQVFHQKSGIPMGANCSPVLADLCLSYMEYSYLSKKENIGSAKRLMWSMRYIDDILTIGSEALKEEHQHIYPTSLPLSFDDTSNGTGHFLDLLIDRTSHQIDLFDKRNDFCFEVIRFPYKSSNQPAMLGLNVLYAQVLRIARICSAKGMFCSNLRSLVDIISNRGYSYSEIDDTLQKVHKRYPILFYKFGIRSQSRLINMI